MSFILKEDIIYVHCKLTDEGRKKIAEGNFNPSKFTVGDSEVNYKYFKENNHNIEDSLVLSPIDRISKTKYTIKSNIEDLDDKYDLVNLGFSETTYDRDVEEIGFFEGTTYNYKQKNTSDYIIQGDYRIDISQFGLFTNKKIALTKTVDYGPNSKEPIIGDYILINWVNPYISDSNFINGAIDANKYTPFIWYKITDIEGELLDNTIEITVDRDLPFFGSNVTPNTYYSYGFIFPKYDSMKGFYNSVYQSDYWEEAALNFEENCNTPPIDSNIWNLNILRTDDLIGLTKYNDTENKSDVYAGLLTYIKNEEFTHNNIGIIHYTNNDPTNKYGEKFEDELSISLPTILWHKNEDNKIGVEFISEGNIYIVQELDLKYYNLIDNWNNLVGKIFPDLKLIIITDQELLFAMSFKSNRNWTLVEPEIRFNSNKCFVDDGLTGTLYYGTKEVFGSFPTIPLPEDIDIEDSTEVDNVNLTTFSLNIPINSEVNDFIWVAIPSAFPIRTKWYVNVFNQGLIGGIKNLNGNLFPEPENIVINGVNYTIYISNYRTKANYVNLLL